MKILATLLMQHAVFNDTSHLPHEESCINKWWICKGYLSQLHGCYSSITIKEKRNLMGFFLACLPNAVT